jgi:Icc-related predicted phosphoesterase
MPPGDILIHAGDATLRGTALEATGFLQWFAKQDYQWKFFVPGNHDFFFERLTQDGVRILHEEYFESRDANGIARLLLPPFSTQWVKDYSITGFPWSLPYGPWAYMAPEEELEKKLEGVGKCDILVSHGPPYGMQDATKRGVHAGSEALLEWVAEKTPALVVCGHIHEARGVHQVQAPGVSVVNAACCNFPNMEDLRQPIVLDLTRQTKVELIQ